MLQSFKKENPKMIIITDEKKYLYVEFKRESTNIKRFKKEIELSGIYSWLYVDFNTNKNIKKMMVVLTKDRFNLKNVKELVPP